MIIAFVAACLIYRELLTGLRERAQTWLAAAAGHAAPNIVLSAFIASSLGGFHGAAGGVFFPALGGLVFPALAVGAVLVLSSTRQPAIDAALTGRI